MLRLVSPPVRQFISKSFRVPGQMIFRSALAVALSGVCLLIAQEPDSHAPPAPGARRDAPGATREFLGLGPVPDPVASKRGGELFARNCSACHGENARGGQAPNLVRSVVVLHDEHDDEIGPVIKNGRPQGGMPAFPQLSHDDIHDLSQYLKLQVELAANRGTYGRTYSGSKNMLTGDVQKGEKFFEANCTACHSVTGDLAKIAAKFSQASVMQARFIWPASREPGRVTVTTPSGEIIAGSILKLDDFDVSIRDSNGTYHYWPASTVEVHREDSLQGHRALLPKYTDADLHNITAFLETLK